MGISPYTIAISINLYSYVLLIKTNIHVGCCIIKNIVNSRSLQTPKNNIVYNRIPEHNTSSITSITIILATH